MSIYTRYHLTLRSSNKKTGPIPVSTTSSNTCPSTCGQWNTCYAASGPILLHWKAVDNGERGTGLREFTTAIRALPEGQLWRANQAGDLPGTDIKINARELRSLVSANKGRRGFTYTHKPMTARNRELVTEANQNGFTINLSADSLEQADYYKTLNAGPVVTVLPANHTGNFRTDAGHLVVVCPAVSHDNVDCESCKLCAWSERDVIIGFPAHGSRKMQVNVKLPVLQ